MRYTISVIIAVVIAGLPALWPTGRIGAGQVWAGPAIPEHSFVALERSQLAPIPIQAEGRSSETIADIPFDKCQELMRSKIAALNANPMGIISVVNTGFMKIIRVCTEPGDVLFTCSEADQWLVITTSQQSADKRCP
jgi:hypothetical protein